MEKYGIDVSKHQEKIDWEQVGSSKNASFVMIRSGYRGNESGKINIDSQFKNNIEGAIDQEIPVGIYFYSQAITKYEATEEASWVIEQIEPYKIDYPVCFDFEGIGKNRVKHVTKEERTSFAVAFLDEVRDAGYSPMMYASQNGFNNNWNTPDFVDNEYQLLCAKYPGKDDGTLRPSFKPNIGFDYAMWQYSCKGKVSGISGFVDFNVHY